MSVTTPTSLRIPPDVLTEIDKRARAYRLNRTEYIIQSATGTLGETAASTLARLQAVEQAIEDLRYTLHGGTP